jgi:hypothetical protein
MCVLTLPLALLTGPALTYNFRRQPVRQLKCWRPFFHFAEKKKIQQMKETVFDQEIQTVAWFL